MLILFLLLAVTTALGIWGASYCVPPQYFSFARNAVIGANVVLALAMIFFARMREIPGGATVLTVASVFFVTEVILGIMVAVALTLRHFWQGANVPFDPSRRHLLGNFALYPLAAAAVPVYGAAYERNTLAIREFTIPVKGNFTPYRIAQISDVHLGPFFSLEDLTELLEKSAAVKADALVITGDLFDDEGQNEEAAGIVDKYVPRFPDGIYFCWGNHEYYRNIPKIRQYLSRTSVKVLRNDSVLARKGDTPLYFAGTDYPMDRAHFDELRDRYAEEALKDIPDNAVTVLLAHHPEFIDNGAAAGVKLTLTGHTHGCQFGLFGVPLFPIFRYTRGMVEHGDSFGYVHSGNGSWFPVRIGCPPEIAVFTLEGDKA